MLRMDKSRLLKKMFRSEVMGTYERGRHVKSRVWAKNLGDIPTTVIPSRGFLKGNEMSEVIGMMNYQCCRKCNWCELNWQRAT